MKIQACLSIPAIVLLLSCCSGVNGDKQSSVESDLKDVIIFHRVTEPNEQAFKFLLPDQWVISGGITRVDAGNAGGSGNAIEAKLYMKLSAPGSKAEIGWLPDTRFFDMRRYPGSNPSSSLFPDGSNYNGMTVMPLPTPDHFIRSVAIPFAHPHARGMNILEVTPLPALAEEYAAWSSKMLSGYRFSYQAAIMTFEYSENGILFLEKMVCIIEDYGPWGAGLWGNKECWYVRAEKNLFTGMAPVFSTIGHSVELNPDWIRREIRSQQGNSTIALKTRQEIARLDREITEHRARTNAGINEILYLNLTGQEDFINPFTGEIERGTNEWNYRWENEQGDVICHNNPNYNPNQDAKLKIQSFKRSEVKKR